MSARAIAALEKRIAEARSTGGLWVDWFALGHAETVLRLAKRYVEARKAADDVRRGLGLVSTAKRGRKR